MNGEFACVRYVKRLRKSQVCFTCHREIARGEPATRRVGLDEYSQYSFYSIYEHPNPLCYETENDE